MTKLSAFGTSLAMGIKQVESTAIVGTITGSGNATFTTTFSGMTGSPLATSVAVLNGDTPDTVATKAVAALNAVANFNAKCYAYSSGATLYVRALLAAANDATFNIAYTNGTCTGLTPDATSDNTVAGVAFADIAAVQSIGGPSLALDTEDVTTHDQATAWEEMVATILRTGEVSLEIVYDPQDNTHDYAGGAGLVKRLYDKTKAAFKMTFPDSTIWYFDAFVTGFEPDAAHDGALTAAVSLKLDGAPVLL